MTNNKTLGWQFTGDDGAFVLHAPHKSSYLYFPLVNEAGMMSVATPTLHGDVKTGQNSFLTLPVSVEDLHNTRSARNFWVAVAGAPPWSATGNSAPQVSQTFVEDGDEMVTLRAGLLWHQVTRQNRRLGLTADVLNFVPASDDQVELMQVTLTNNGRAPVTFIPTAAIPIYGRSADNLRDHRHVTSLLHRIRTVRHGVVVRPTLTFDERGHRPNRVSYAVLGAEGDGAPPVSFFPVIEDFIGEGGNLEWPAAVVQPEMTGVPAGTAVDGHEAMGALRFAEITLAPGEAHTYILILAVDSGEAFDKTSASSVEPLRPHAVSLTSASSDFGELRLRRAQSSRRAVEPSNLSRTAAEGEPGDELVRRYGSAAQAAQWLQVTADHWQAMVQPLAFQSADPRFNGWLKWVSVQPFLRRLFGNSFVPYHDYGRGGRGWRDLWQDCLALLMLEPEPVHDLLFSSFAGVRVDGSNATIIGSRPGEFLADRNNIPRVWMDHGAWPYLTTRLYIDQSGDLAFLLQEQAYFKDAHINRCQARDAGWTPEQGTQLRTRTGEIYHGSVLEHLLIQHLTAFFNVGASGNNILLEGADWNDGMDMARVRGESVAFSALYASNLADLAGLVRALERLGVAEVALAAELQPLLDTLGAAVDYENPAAKQARLAAYFATCGQAVSGDKIGITLSDLAHDLETKAAWLSHHIRAQEWITDSQGYGWFNGYYDNEGRRVEGDHPHGVRMTLTGQVFALMGGIATDAQAAAVVAAADHYLYDRRVGGYRLNTDFGGMQFSLGRCFGFAFGHKENGAMFSHMAVMYANALYRRGLVHEGFKVLDEIYQQCADFEASRIYPGIPEYISERGRGLYPWLTGSASWYLLTLLTEAFGVKGNLGDLVLEPKLVRAQFDAAGEASVRSQFAGRDLGVVYQNPQRLEYGAYRVLQVTVDGVAAPIERTGASVRLVRDVITRLTTGEAHRVTVNLGA